MSQLWTKSVAEQGAIHLVPTDHLSWLVTYKLHNQSTHTHSHTLTYIHSHTLIHTHINSHTHTTHTHSHTVVSNLPENTTKEEMKKDPEASGSKQWQGCHYNKHCLHFEYILFLLILIGCALPLLYSNRLDWLAYFLVGSWQAMHRAATHTGAEAASPWFYSSYTR